MMPNPDLVPRNWFETGAKTYAAFRPNYPEELAAFLAASAPDRGIALDVGCGNGQLTAQLAQHFDQVIGADPSRDQIAHAMPEQNVQYVCAGAESLPLDARCASLITAAQAAHWFDLSRFYEEVRRIGKTGTIVALISYGVLRLDDGLNDRFEQFYWREIGPYWPPERKLVDEGYADLPFPFDEISSPALEIRKAWTFDELLGYIATWSAVKRAREAGQVKLLEHFAADLSTAWGDAHIRRSVQWPISLRVGRLDGL